MSRDLVSRDFAAVLERAFSRKAPAQVLDVGCGFDSEWSGFVVPPSFREARVVGMDLREEDLRRNELLDEYIVGDVQTHTLPAASFDAIVCWNVLEHLPEPTVALRNLVGALADDGILILAFPNLYSLKGVVTKVTPFRVHVWLYRRYFGVPDAGAPGKGPFPTYLRRSMSPRGIDQFAREAGLGVEYRALYGGSFAELFPGRRLLGFAWRAASLVYRLVTLGRSSPELSETVFVLRKRAA